jgi:hypothetical protein
MNFSKILFFSIISITFENPLKFPFEIENRKIKKPSLPYKSFLEIPQLPVIENEEERMCLEMCIGNQPTCRKLVIHGQSFFTWVVDVHNNESGVKSERRFNLLNTSTIEINRTQITLHYDEEKYVSGFTGRDDLYINNKKITRQKFIIATESNVYYGYEGMIGLGYMANSYERDYSFIDQLYNNKIISHKVFTQSFTTSDKGEISFGEIPKNIVNDYKNYGRCNALDKIKNGERYKNRKWECAITKALINDNDNISIEGENLVSFFSYRNRALVPSTFFKTLVQTYFKDLLNQKICETIKDRRYDVVSCKEIPSNSPTLTLVFGDWGMKLTKENLYIKNEQNNKYEFIFYHKQNFEHFTLGRPIVRFFHMVYDYQNQQIGFYSTTNVIRIAKSEPEPPKIFEFAEDKESKKDDDKKDEEKKRKHVTPEDIMNKNDKNPSNIHKDKNDKLSAAYIIQILFMGFIFIIVAVFLIFGCYLYIRHKRKTSFYSSEFYMKQTDKFIGTRLGD